MSLFGSEENSTIYPEEDPAAKDQPTAMPAKPSTFSFASPQVTLIVGPDEIRLVAHQVKLSQWPYFRVALLGAFEEAKSQCINLPEDRPAVVQAFLEFIYSGNYVYEPPSVQATFRCSKVDGEAPDTNITCPCEDYVACGTPAMANTKPNFDQCLICEHSVDDHRLLVKAGSPPPPPSSDPEVVLNKMEFHAQVYFLADKFGISKLQKLAADRVYEPEQPPSDKKSINDLKVARLIYANTPTTDKLLRRTALEKTVDYLLATNSFTLISYRTSSGQNAARAEVQYSEANALLEELTTQDTSFAVDIIKCMAINGNTASNYY